jgi:hypothetical protein
MPLQVVITSLVMHIKYLQKNDDNGPLAYWNTLTLANLPIGLIHVEQVITNEMQSGYSPFVPLDAKYKEVTSKELKISTNFVSHAAEGRKNDV